MGTQSPFSIYKRLKCRLIHLGSDRFPENLLLTYASTLLLIVLH